MVLGKLPVPERPASFDNTRTWARACYGCSRYVCTPTAMGLESQISTF